MRRRQESQISKSLTRQNNNFARASRFFVHFFASTARLPWSLPVKMPNFTFCEQAMTKFILFMNLAMVDRNSAPEEFACIWHNKRFGIIMIETEKMWIDFSKRRFRGCQPSWYLLQSVKKLPNIYARRDWCKREYLMYCIVLYFWTSAFSVRVDSILKSDGDFIPKWKFPDCVHFFGAWARQAVIEAIAVVHELTKRTQEKLFADWAQ